MSQEGVLRSVRIWWYHLFISFELCIVEVRFSFVASSISVLRRRALSTAVHTWYSRVYACVEAIGIRHPWERGGRGGRCERGN